MTKKEVFVGPVNSARDPLKVLKHTFSKKKKEKTQTLETCETRYPNTALMSKLYPVVSEWF